MRVLLGGHCLSHLGSMNWGFSEDSRPCLGTWNPSRGKPVVLCLASPSVGSMNSCCFHSSVSKKPEVRNQLLSWCPILLPPASLPKDTASIHTQENSPPSQGHKQIPHPVLYFWTKHCIHILVLLFLYSPDILGLCLSFCFLNNPLIF